MAMSEYIGYLIRNDDPGIVESTNAASLCFEKLVAWSRESERHLSQRHSTNVPTSNLYAHAQQKSPAGTQTSPSIPRVPDLEAL